ncbi:MAG: hypothetical protein ETSY1_14560 [Candidatus Entotheonella factor]|uniref:Metal-dependent phosphohydrolase n=1 Tax=Entotheonella factor TaxID=1429438 RepID=W4LP92_ENTF1|nr:MAG: hypothetical protein ETSY1_14560 [Candidatus Entotheonella factor]
MLTGHESQINPRIECFITFLTRSYQRLYPLTDSTYGDLAADLGRRALYTLAKSTAAYHDLDHTLLVTSAGIDILRGKHLLEGSVTPRTWAHMIVAMCYHDIGFIRGASQDDWPGHYTTGLDHASITLPESATDAALAPYHVDRGKHIMQEMITGYSDLDTDLIASYIERTRFPVPQDHAYAPTDDPAGLVRAADLIGQLADPKYLDKHPALFQEFEETGTNAILGHTSPTDLRYAYPAFFRTCIQPYIEPAQLYLQLTPQGQRWVNSLYGHVATVERELRAMAADGKSSAVQCPVAV